ncbi:MAG: hypothetical protein LLG42_16270 [Chloroflexi bacterium]|nr:hypothetical protein [Chloroflexota bacterium]
MDSETEFEVKLILGDLEELVDREDELTKNSNFLSSYFEDWINSLSRFTSIWNIASREQLDQIIQKYEDVKPIALKLKLPWPEELSK